MTCLKTKMECWFQFIPVFLQHFIHLQLPCPYFFVQHKNYRFWNLHMSIPILEGLLPIPQDKGLDIKGLSKWWILEGFHLSCLRDEWQDLPLSQFCWIQSLPRCQTSAIWSCAFARTVTKRPLGRWGGQDGTSILGESLGDSFAWQRAIGNVNPNKVG